MKRVVTTLTVLATLALTTFAHAVPSTVSVSGRIVEANAPLTGEHEFTFRMYTAPGGGTEIWFETQTVLVEDGLVFADLGMNTPLTTAVFDGSALFLEIQIDGVVMQPRLSMGTVPYAFRAAVADEAISVGGLTTNDLQRRVAGTCPVGQSIGAINTDGTVTCQAGSTGDITGVTASTGLVGGATSGNATLGIDSNYVQRRVSSSCASGSSIRTISSIGAVVCEPDDNSGGDITSVLAGTGLSGGSATGSATLSANTSYLQRRVGTNCGAGGAMSAISSTGIATCRAFVPQSPAISSYIRSTTSTTPLTLVTGVRNFCALSEVSTTNSGSAGVYRYCEVTRNINGTWTLAARSNGATLPTICRMYCF